MTAGSSQENHIQIRVHIDDMILARQCALDDVGAPTLRKGCYTFCVASLTMVVVQYNILKLHGIYMI